VRNKEEKMKIFLYSIVVIWINTSNVFAMDPPISTVIAASGDLNEVDQEKLGKLIREIKADLIAKEAMMLKSNFVACAEQYNMRAELNLILSVAIILSKYESENSHEGLFNALCAYYEVFQAKHKDPNGLIRLLAASKHSEAKAIYEQLPAYNSQYGATKTREKTSLRIKAIFSKQENHYCPLIQHEDGKDTSKVSFATSIIILCDKYYKSIEKLFSAKKQ